jgi:spore coat polysaccharide biosynthesis predicted glycosyltransferase SpsG
MGHLYRSLNLADGLRARGHQLQFLVNDHAASLDILKQRGYVPLVADLADLASGWETAVLHGRRVHTWINDRLDTDRRHAERIKAQGLNLVTFDDRGSGAANADLHIAALAFEDAGALAGRRVLHGVDYLMLNPEIARHQRLRSAPGSILVTLGGSDTYGVTVRIVELMARKGLAATVVVGPGFVHDEALEAALKAAPSDAFVLRRGVPSMAAEMARHELAITGGGMTPFEANAAGLPCIVVANEIFEIPVGRALERLGGSVFAGHHQALDLSVFDRELPLESMSRCGMERIGLGGTARVLNALEALLP